MSKTVDDEKRTCLACGNKFDPPEEDETELCGGIFKALGRKLLCPECLTKAIKAGLI